MVQANDGTGPMKRRINWRTDKIVEMCAVLAGDLPRAKRALVAARRSGRDTQFNAYLAFKRLRLEVARPIIPVVDWMSGILRG